MRVKLRFFSVYRDATGAPEVYIDVSEGLKVSQVVHEVARLYPSLVKVFEEVKPVVLVNGEVADGDMVLSGGDVEIALVPPASGGANIRVELFSEDLSVDKVISEVVGEGVGAIAIFVGTVKSVVDGHRVCELFYEVYEPYVINVLDRIAREGIAKYNLHAAHIYHRVGSAKAGQKTIVIAVSAKGRREALEAVSYILERVKGEAPIYKLERRDDGEYWVVGDGRRVPRARAGELDR